MTQCKYPSLFSGKAAILLVLMVLGGLAGGYRLVAGLGATTNLTDVYPWGLWIAVDVLTGVALAAGGFSIAAAVYVFNMKKYKPIAKPAILTAFLGYLMVVFGLFFDVGKPFSFWHPIFMWQHHSVMFEIVMCIALYTTVLALEFAPSLLEKLGYKSLADLLHNKLILYPLVIAGITLSYLHQSSLGALFLLMPQKLHGLWYSPIMPQLFYLSAIAAGLAMVSVETILGARAFNHEPPMDILKGLARGTIIALLVYAGVRLAYLMMSGKFGLVFSSGTASLLFLIEIVGGILLPIALLSSKGKESVSGMLGAQTLVVAGVVLNRFNTNFLAQAGVAGGAGYFPSIIELLITAGVVSLGITLYRAAIIYLPILTHAEE